MHVVPSPSTAPRVGLAVALLLVGTTAQAGARVATTPPELRGPMRTAHAAAECRPLFGPPAQSRPTKLYWIHEEPGGVTIAHSSDSWDEPVALVVRGLTVLGSRPTSRGLRAQVSVSEQLARAVGCRAGAYELGVGDSLTSRGRVLAVLSHAVLLEQGGRLAFMVASGALEPRWLLAWSAPGTVRIEGGGSSEVTTVGIEEGSYRRRTIY